MSNWTFWRCSRGQHHHAFNNLHVGVGFIARFLFVLDVNGCIGGVRKQAPFIGMDAIEHAFSGEGSALNKVEGAGIEHLAAGIPEPDGAKGNLF